MKRREFLKTGPALALARAPESAAAATAEQGSSFDPWKTVNIGDEVSIFDWQDGSRPEDFSAACGASVYDLIMHLNPLLPRRSA